MVAQQTCYGPDASDACAHKAAYTGNAQADRLSSGVDCESSCVKYDDYPGNFGSVSGGERSRLHYLDHAGATLYSQQQLHEALKDLSSGLVSNPHSGQALAGSEPTASTLDDVRRQTLAYFGAPPGAYVCVLTSGATAALALLADAFPWKAGVSRFLYTAANHTSVLGMREIASRRGAVVLPVHADHRYPHAHLQCAASTGNPAARPLVARNHVQADCRAPPEGSASDGAATSAGEAVGTLATRHLLALPAECNLTGARCSDTFLQALLDGRAQLPDNVQGDELWTMLDAAKAAQLHPPDLSRTPVHFAVLSFYKIFGYPTGLGALLVRADCLPALRPTFVGGGALLHSEPTTWPNAVERRSGVAALESGTPNFQAARAVRFGFAALERAGGAGHLQHRVTALARWAVCALRGLHHSNGRAVCTVYGWGDGRTLGIGDDGGGAGTVVAFNVFDADGAPIGWDLVQQVLALSAVVVRAGCCCNPGACAAALGASPEESASARHAGRTCSGGPAVVAGRHTGVVRASLGYMTQFDDVWALVHAVHTGFGDCGAPTALRPRLTSRGPPACAVAALYVYPIKSCAGQSAASWPLTARGLLHDRCFMLVDEAGRALTAQRHPLLALLHPRVDVVHGLMTVHWLPPASGAPRQPDTQACGCDAVTVQLEPPCDAAARVPSRQARTCRGVRVRAAAPTDVDAWFSARLGVRCSLVRCAVDDDGRWHADDGGPASTGESRGEDGCPPFANEGALLVASVASARAFQRAMAAATSARDSAGASTAPGEECWRKVCGTAALDGGCDGVQGAAARGPYDAVARRFRVNVLVTASAAHEEDGWRSLLVPCSAAPPQACDRESACHRTFGQSVESCTERQVRLCTQSQARRCSMVGVCWQTGQRERGTSALRVLAAYRTSARGITWGVYMRPPKQDPSRSGSEGLGWLAVGARVQPETVAYES